MKYGQLIEHALALRAATDRASANQAELGQVLSASHGQHHILRRPAWAVRLRASRRFRAFNAPRELGQRNSL